jgi:outer membrane protein assembly factor BamB
MEARSAVRTLAYTGRMPFGLLIFVAFQCSAVEWTQYRGPNHDGVSPEIIRTNWAAVPPRQVWKVPLGAALSSFAIAGGRVFTQVRRVVDEAEEEFCVALNAETGVEIWGTSVGIARYPDVGVGNDDGPRSTPSVDGGRVYVLSSYLRLFCLDAATGDVVWSRNLVTEFGGFVIPWQNAASPLVVGDLVLVNGNAPNQCLMAFNKQTGEVVWQRHNDRMTHSTPVAAVIAGVEQVVFYTQSGLIGVAAATGDALWRFPVSYNGVSAAASPVVAGDRVYCSRAYPTAGGAVVVGVAQSAGAFIATQVWARPNQLMNHWCTPVHYNGHLYGMYGQSVLTLKCVEFATGTERWSMSGFGYGSVLVVGGRILALGDTGDLVLVDPNPAAYTEIARFRPLTGKCWNVGAVSDGRIYVRSTLEAVSLDVALPLLRLRPELGENDAFSLAISSTDGAPIASNRAANIILSTTTNLAGGDWTLLPDSLVLSNGQLRFTEPERQPREDRLYRAEERP